MAAKKGAGKTTAPLSGDYVVCKNKKCKAKICLGLIRCGCCGTPTEALEAYYKKPRYANSKFQHATPSPKPGTKEPLDG
jgi:hypothetical protein